MRFLLDGTDAMLDIVSLRFQAPRFIPKSEREIYETNRRFEETCTRVRTKRTVGRHLYETLGNHARDRSIFPPAEGAQGKESTTSKWDLFAPQLDLPISRRSAQEHRSPRRRTRRHASLVIRFYLSFPSGRRHVLSLSNAKDGVRALALALARERESDCRKRFERMEAFDKGAEGDASRARGEGATSAPERRRHPNRRRSVKRDAMARGSCKSLPMHAKEDA